MFDIVVVGSGPAGWTAAIYGVRAGLSVGIVTSEVDYGGALMNTTLVENFPGFAEGIDGPDLMMAMQDQAERLGAELLFEDVVALELSGEVKKITTGENVYEAKSVILAMGAEHRHLGIPGEEELTGKGVTTCATCDGFFHKDKPVVVVGGGDSACEEALYLSTIASHVTMLVRRDEFRASYAMAQKVLENDKITVEWSTLPDHLEGEDKLEAVVVKDGRRFECSGLFVAIGHTPRSGLVIGQAALDPAGYVLCRPEGTQGLSRLTQCWTPAGDVLEGVFGCGDLVDTIYRQAITAAGSGCQAALDAKRYLEEK